MDCVLYPVENSENTDLDLIQLNLYESTKMIENSKTTLLEPKYL